MRQLWPPMVAVVMVVIGADNDAATYRKNP
jgi:hypothetical protein